SASARSRRRRSGSCGTRRGRRSCGASWKGRAERAAMRSPGERRTLVTGGAGFLGSHLCERLLARGDDVLCVDNYYTGTKRNIASFLGNPHFEALRHDVTFPLYVEVDRIYNLAC